MTYSERERNHPNFTALHRMPARTSHEKAVCPSVCPSVCLSDKRVNCDKTKERSVLIFVPYERSRSLVFRETEWLVGDDPSS